MIDDCLADHNEIQNDFYLFMCRDFNSLTNEDNGRVLSANVRISGDDEFFLDWSSQDSCSNEFGRHLLSLCGAMNCSVLNGVTRFGFDDGETYKSPTKKLIWNAGDATTFLAVLQSRELQAQLDQARNEIRTDINRALQTFVDCLQAASACIIKKIKSGGCRKSAKWFNKECYDCRKFASSKLRQYRRTQRSSDRQMCVEARKEYRALLTLERNFLQYLAENRSNPKLFWSELRACSMCVNTDKCKVIIIIIDNFCIALFSCVPKLTALYNILHFLSFTNIIHIIMTTNNV